MQVKSTCCRSLPRCAACPVLLAARARGRFTRDVEAALVTEVLVGTPPRELPPCVRDALAALAAPGPEPERTQVLH